MLGIILSWLELEFERRGYAENTQSEICKIQKITNDKDILIVGSD
jgi:hypothetical protein